VGCRQNRKLNDDLGWDRLDHMGYDEGADVLDLSIGEPQRAMGIHTGEGVTVRYDEARKEVVGLTLIGPRARVLKGLSGEQ
jgi:uncharacterized protein YuzE